MLTVEKLMTPVPHTVSPDTSLRTVLGIMKVGGYRQIPVLECGRLVGIITDRDIRLVMNSPVVKHRQVEDEDLLNSVTVGGCMTTDPIYVHPETPAFEAAEMLSMYKFGALPVVDAGALVGIITVTDFLKYFSDASDESE